MTQPAQLSKKAWEALGDTTIRVSDLYKEVTPQGGGEPIMLLDAEAVQGTGPDGKFYRYALENVGGLTVALEREKENGRTLRQFEDSAGNRITPAQAREALGKVTGLEEEVERLKSRRKDGEDWTSREAELQRLHQEELQKRDTKVDRYRGKLKKTLLEEAASSALEKAGFSEAARALAPQLIAEMDLREDGDDIYAIIRNNEGGERLVGDGSGGTRRMTALDRAKEFAGDTYWSKFLDAHDTSGGGGNDEGGGTPPPRSTSRPDSATQNDPQPVRPMEALRQARERERQKQGT